MFTKALIVSPPKPGDNIYKVRVPLFEDTTGTEIIYDALCCHAPGVYNGFNPGDCVYITFEDAKLNIPVIIGRLLVNEQDDYSKGYFNNLEVSNSAHLPMSTMFGDGLSIQNLYDSLNYLSNCPYAIGDVYCTTNTDILPEQNWAGTTWTNLGTTTAGTTNIYNWRRDS